MAYHIAEIEVTQPLPTIALAPHENGIAILVRRKGCPIEFWMQARRRGSRLETDELARLISEKTSTRLLSESIREELRVVAHPKDSAEGSSPSLCIVVCTKDRPQTLQRCLNSILKIDRIDCRSSIEVLVVDNAPSDERTRLIVESLPDVRYVYEPKSGLDFARNRALHECKSDLLAFLDDDVVVDKGWYQGLIEAWRENPDAGAFTGLVLPLELQTRAQILFEGTGGFGRGFKKIRFGQTLPGNPVYPCGAGSFGAGANMILRRDVLHKLGGFDDALDTGKPLPGGGDLDIFYRVVRGGYPLVYEPSCTVFHEHRRDLKALRRQYWSWGLGLMAFVCKCYETDPSQRTKLRRLVRWWFFYQLGQLQRSLRRRHMLPPDMILAELRGAIAGLLGEYGRSQKRVEKIRRQHTPQDQSTPEKRPAPKNRPVPEDMA
jgi:GT2 family glycosyltransferase